MATTYVPTSSTSERANRLKMAMRALREARKVLGEELNITPGQVNGVTTDANNFTLYATELGAATGGANGYASANAAAKAIYDEVFSLHFILTKPNGVGDAAGAAIDKVCALLGV